MNSIRQNIVLLSLIVLPPMGACSGLSDAGKAELRAAEPAILALDTWACNESALIPVVGAAIDAVACPGEEALVKRAIDNAVASDAGAPMGAQRVVTKAASPGRRVCVGRLLASVKDAGADGGK